MKKVPMQTPDYTPEENPGFIPNAIYNSSTPIVYVPPEASGTTVQVLDNSFNDDVARYMETPESIQRNAQLLRVRNQAYDAVGPTVDNANPPLIGRQDSDPKGG
jgi:hypothetical protein